MPPQKIYSEILVTEFLGEIFLIMFKNSDKIKMWK